MQTLDLRQIMADAGITHKQARDSVRKRLKYGFIWSRLNPDLLSGAELLPYVSMDRPPKSGAELLPFPISAKLNLDPASPNYLERLAEEKIRWCYAQGATELVRAKVLTQLSTYYDPLPRSGINYNWITLDPLRSPYRSSLVSIFPALQNYVQQGALPKPLGREPGEAWHTPEADQNGVTFRLSTTLEEEDSLVLTVSLTARETFWARTYKLNPDRYAFIRQQVFYLLGPRLEPWDDDNVQQPGVYRGLVYRQPSIK